jgi:hypothetical protein
MRGAERVTVKCEFCAFFVVASAPEGHEAFEKQECNRPRPVTSKRRRSGGLALSLRPQ